MKLKLNIKCELKIHVLKTNKLFFWCCDRLEYGVYNISRMRESATKRFKVFQIPIDWLLDSGYATKVIFIKLKYAYHHLSS
jgi:hypothetical protein